MVVHVERKKKIPHKREAILEAVISLSNEIGLHQISMTKISDRVGITPATIYVYFDSKETMINTLYLDAKNKFADAVLQALDVERSIQSNIESAMRDMLDYIIEHKAHFLFLEQFPNFPLAKNPSLENENEIMEAFSQILDEGKEKGILKQVDNTLSVSLIYHLVSQFAKSYFEGSVELTETAVQSVVDMGWDAIRRQ